MHVFTKFRKKFRTPLLLACLAFFATGCFGGGSSSGSSSSSPTTITMWGLFETSQNMQPFIQAYEQSHKGVQIQYTEKDVTTYESDLLNALASGTGPDIFYIHNDWLPKYENKLTPAPAKAATGYQTFSVKDYEDTFADVASEDFINNNQVYAVPLDLDTMVLYYNKDILGSNGIAVPPTTWDQLSADAQKIAQSNSSGYFTKSGAALGTSTNIERAQDIMYLLMLQDGTQPYNSDNTTSTIDQSVSASSTSSGNQFPGAQALTYYTSFANPYAPNYDWNAQSDYSLDAFSEGKLAMTYGYYYDRATILQKSPNLNFGVAPVPQPSLNQNLVNFSNYWGYAVSKQTKHPNTAWDFLNSITTKDSLEAYYKLDSLPSSRKDIIAEQVNDPVLGVYASSSLTSKSFYKIDETKVDTIITTMIDDVTLRNKSVNAALANAAQQISLLSNSSGQ